MDYYQILEVSRDADVPTIKRKFAVYLHFRFIVSAFCRYKELAQKWHPSLHADSPTEAISKYREVTEAYEVLSEGIVFFSSSCCAMSFPSHAIPSLSFPP
jgi:oligoribonuclease (3'-5' exoribonuclease)